MEQLHIRTVLITGSSSGIGRACAIELAATKGYRLLLCARRMDRLESLTQEIHNINPDCETHTFKLDVRNAQEVETTLHNLPAEWKTIDILINNAGLSQGLDAIDQGNIGDWDRMIDTNVKGLLYVTKHVIPLMGKSKQPHIINLGSIAGKEVYPNGNVYCATKHAVDALNQAMRIDLLEQGIKVSAINPGMVETEFSEVRFHGDTERANAVYRGLTPLSGKDIAEIVLFVLSRPPHVNINDLLVMPSAQATGTIVNRNIKN